MSLLDFLLPRFCSLIPQTALSPTLNAKIPFSSTDVRLGLYPWGVPPASQSEKARRYEGEWQNHRKETEDKQQRERRLAFRIVEYAASGRLVNPSQVVDE